MQSWKWIALTLSLSPGEGTHFYRASGEGRHVAVPDNRDRDTRSLPTASVSQRVARLSLSLGRGPVLRSSTAEGDRGEGEHHFPQNSYGLAIPPASPFFARARHR